MFAQGEAILKLATKYNLFLIGILIICYLAINGAAYVILQGHARNEVVRQAATLMEAASAMRTYTIREIKPLLALQNTREFLPQSVPSYAATQNFNALREKNPEYRYKEATLNPTNPRDRAADWEADIIQAFRQDHQLKYLTLVRDTPVGKTLYYARPIRIADQACLSCHGAVDDAPDSMLRMYGPENGFNWKLNEIVGSQIVSVPLTLPVAWANTSFVQLAVVLSLAFVLVFVVMHLVNRRICVRRVLAVSRVVEAINQGNTDRPKFDVRGNDEISQLCESIEHVCRQQVSNNRMLANTMKFTPGDGGDD